MTESPTAAHAHKVNSETRFPSGRTMEHCECGATRERQKDGSSEPWHTCALCVMP
jgi:hypothetical protein